MYTPRPNPYYSPSSVGALMDPTFLRRAVREAEGRGHANEPLSPSLAKRWRIVIDALMALGGRLARR
jgi:hypothetical protein